MYVLHQTKLCFLNTRLSTRSWERRNEPDDLLPLRALDTLALAGARTQKLREEAWGSGA